MDAYELTDICDKAMKDGKYVYLFHFGVPRDVYPYEIARGRLYCYCTLHPERDVESLVLENITNASVSQNSCEDEYFPFYTTFG
jgi:hypothetical protein